MKKIIIILGALALVFSLAGYYFVTNQNEPPTKNKITNSKEADFEQRKATFAIFTNGTFRIFTNSRYHNLSEDVYLTSENPNIITVTKEGVTWKDFFESLPMKVTKDCLTTGTGQLFCSDGEATLKFYLNGERDDDVLEKEIVDGDRLLISYGDETKEMIESQMERVPEPN